MSPLPLSAHGTVGAGLPGGALQHNKEYPAAFSTVLCYCFCPGLNTPVCDIRRYLRQSRPARDAAPLPAPRRRKRRRHHGGQEQAAHQGQPAGERRDMAAPGAGPGLRGALGPGRAPGGGLRPPWGSRSVVGERGASSVLGLPPRLKWVKKEKKGHVVSWECGLRA